MQSHQKRRLNICFCSEKVRVCVLYYLSWYKGYLFSQEWLNSENIECFPVQEYSNT